MTDALDIVDEFRRNILLEFLRQIVYRAGEHEIFPYDKAQFVTGIPEHIIGIIAASPDADAVEMCHLRLKEQIIGSLRRHPGQDVILRNVVASHRKNPNAVHFMGKGFAVFVLLNMYRHSAKANPLAPGIQHFSSGKQSDFHLIKRLISKTVGPPQLGICDFNRIISFRRSGNISSRICPSIRSRHAYLPFVSGKPSVVFSKRQNPLFSRLIHIHTKLQRYFPRLMLLGDIHAVQPGLCDPKQLHISPDACIRQARAPVPSEHAVRLSQVREPAHGIAAARNRPLFICLFDEPCGGMQFHLQFILITQQILDGILPDTMHIRRRSKQRSIQIDIRQGIDPVKMQQHPVAAAESFVRFKMHAVGKIILHDLKRFQFIVPVIGIFHFSVIQQILINTAGNRGGKRLSRPVLCHSPLTAIRAVKPLNQHTLPPFLLPNPFPSLRI